MWFLLVWVPLVSLTLGILKTMVSYFIPILKMKSRTFNHWKCTQKISRFICCGSNAGNLHWDVLIRCFLLVDFLMREDNLQSIPARHTSLFCRAALPLFSFLSSAWLSLPSRLLWHLQMHLLLRTGMLLLPASRAVQPYSGWLWMEISFPPTTDTDRAKQSLKHLRPSETWSPKAS